jgi:multidrug efflux system outer membrane protein
MKTRYSFLAIAALLIAASCNVSQRYKRPAVNASNLYRDSLATDTNSIANLPWRSLFADTVLQNLIQEGINNNLNLRNAILKIAEANATLKEAKAAYFPTLSTGVTVTKAKLAPSKL